jgi:hypothetical protein
VKLEYFGNLNSFKDDSAGIRFFCCSQLPKESGLEVHYFGGFVEELLVESDPEYHWMDNFRASRISNEQRILVLYNLSS